jgi:hypothetical protein
MHNRQAITPRLLWRSLKDFDLWPLYAISLTFGNPSTPPNRYLTLNLRRLGFSVIVTNLLTVPNTALTIVTLLGITYLSEHWNSRALVAVIAQLWMLPFLIVLYAMDMTKINRWVAWAILTLLLSFPSRKPLPLCRNRYQ